MVEFVLSYLSHLKSVPFASKEFQSIFKHIEYIFFKFKILISDKTLGLHENSSLKMYCFISQDS